MAATATSKPAATPIWAAPASELELAAVDEVAASAVVVALVSDTPVDLAEDEWWLLVVLFVYAVDDELAYDADDDVTVVL